MWGYVVSSIFLAVLVVILYEWKYTNIYKQSIFGVSPCLPNRCLPNRCLPNRFNNYLNPIGLLVWLVILILCILSIIEFVSSNSTDISVILFLFLDGLFLLIILGFFFGVIFETTRCFTPPVTQPEPESSGNVKFSVLTPPEPESSGNVKFSVPKRGLRFDVA